MYHYLIYQVPCSDDLKLLTSEVKAAELLLERVKRLRDGQMDEELHGIMEKVNFCQLIQFDINLCTVV